MFGQTQSRVTHSTSTSTFFCPRVGLVFRYRCAICLSALVGKLAVVANSSRTTSHSSWRSLAQKFVAVVVRQSKVLIWVCTSSFELTTFGLPVQAKTTELLPAIMEYRGRKRTVFYLSSHTFFTQTAKIKKIKKRTLFV